MVPPSIGALAYRILGFEMAFELEQDLLVRGAGGRLICKRDKQFEKNALDKKTQSNQSRKRNKQERRGPLLETRTEDSIRMIQQQKLTSSDDMSWLLSSKEEKKNKFTLKINKSELSTETSSS